jgi:hypothetical protein
MKLWGVAPGGLQCPYQRDLAGLQANVAEGSDMQSVICAAKPRSNIVAKREARATSIRLESNQTLHRLALQAGAA